jgi:hypothetical protein
MQPTAKHLEVESTFRRLLSDYELPSPDRVEYEAESVLFLWDEPRLAVFVDFDEFDRDAEAVMTGLVRE